MRMTLRDGFVHPSQLNPHQSNEEFDIEIARAAGRRVVVQGVESIRMGTGGLRVRLHDTAHAQLAQQVTGWQVAAERTLTSALKPMEGHAAVVVAGVAYNSLDVEEDTQ